MKTATKVGRGQVPGGSDALEKVGNVFLPSDLAQRLTQTSKRLGPEYSLANLVRRAFVRGIEQPHKLQRVPGPFPVRLGTVACPRGILAQARRTAAEAFGGARGAYSDFVRSSLQALLLELEDLSAPAQTKNSSRSETTLPAVNISIEMNRRLQAALSVGIDWSRGRFLRLAAQDALQSSAALPEPEKGPFSIALIANGSSGLKRKIIKAGQGAPDAWLRRALDARLTRLGY